MVNKVARCGEIGSRCKTGIVREVRESRQPCLYGNAYDLGERENRWQSNWGVIMGHERGGVFRHGSLTISPAPPGTPPKPMQLTELPSGGPRAQGPSTRITIGTKGSGLTLALRSIIVDG